MNGPQEKDQIHPQNSLISTTRFERKTKNKGVSFEISSAK